jgi:RNA polymerase primary sigma factor
MPAQKSPSILGDTPPPFSAPPAGDQEFNAVFDQWKKQRTPELNTKLIQTVQPVIDTAVTSYGGKTPSPNLKARAKLLALDAMDSYDPARGNVKNHLLSQLQRIRRLSAKEQNIISIPEQVGLDFGHLNKAETELVDSLGRDPTDEELADFTGLSTRRIRKVRAFNQPVAEGMTAVTSEDGANTDVASTLPNSKNSFESWLDFVYGDLAPTDKLIMDMTLGRNGRKKTDTKDIARRLNITPGAVSQRAAKIQQMIDTRYTHNF